MPSNFQNRNGATLAGHSDRKSEYRKAGNYHSGSKMSRNQQTGEQGRINAQPGEVTDTSKMNPHEKLKYMNALGLLNPTQKQQLADMDAAASAPKEEPVQQTPAKPVPNTNPVKELSDKLMRIFKQKPDLLQGIVKTLQSVPKEQLKDAAQRVLKSMDGIISDNPTEVFSTVMRAIEQKAEPEAQDDIDFDEVEQEAPRNRSGKMSEKEFRETNAYLGADFVDSIIKQVKQFQDFEEALFTVDMAIENVDDVNDVRAVRNSMASAADDLGSRFEMVQDSTEEDEEQGEPEEGSIDWIRKINKFAFDNKAKAPFDSYASFRDLLKNKHDANLFQDYLEMIERNPKTKPLYDLAMHKLNDFDSEEGEESRFINIGDAVFSIIKDGEGVEQSSGTESTEPSGEIDVSNMSPGIKHAYERDKEAYNAPDLETGLDILRKSKGHGQELKELLQYFADEMKKEGAKPASINKTLNHYMSQLKDNYFKFLKAQNAMVNNAEAYDPDEGSEIEHNMLSFESAMEDYDRGQLTDHEEGFIDLYKYLHGE